MTWKVSRKTQRWGLLTLVAVVCIAAGASYVSAIVQAQNAAVRTECKANLNSVTFSIRRYLIYRRAMPAAVSRNVESQAETSWRVELLRFFEPSIFSDYRSDLPWNSPENLAVAKKVEKYGSFVLNRRHSGQDVTQILAIRYPGGPWDAQLDEKTRLLPALALIPESTVRTLEPVDITLDELKKLLAIRDERRIPVYIQGIDTTTQVATVELLESIVP